MLYYHYYVIAVIVSYCIITTFHDRIAVTVLFYLLLIFNPFDLTLISFNLRSQCGVTVYGGSASCVS